LIQCFLPEFAARLQDAGRGARESSGFALSCSSASKKMEQIQNHRRGKIPLAS
jgi:hypothetical protein